MLLLVSVNELLFKMYPTLTYSELITDLLSPPRIPYNDTELGSEDQTIGDFQIKRLTITLHDNDGIATNCTLFKNTTRGTINNSCVVYFHSNLGNQTENLLVLPRIISKFDYCTMDLAGRGKSKHAISTWGFKEKIMAQQLVGQLKKDYHRIFLWGRGLGTTVPILYSHITAGTTIDGLILDSPFASMEQKLAREINSRVPLEEHVLKSELAVIGDKLHSKLSFDIMTMNYLAYIQQLPTPILIVTPLWISESQQREIESFYSALQSPKKQLIKVEGANEGERLYKDLSLIVSWIEGVAVHDFDIDVLDVDDLELRIW